MESYDVIVFGAGGVGSAAMFHLARRGAKVLGLDRFEPPHNHGSSHGRTRVIRQAYFEHADYVPLLKRAYELWAELSQLCGQKLYHETGVLVIGPRDGHVVPGVLHAAKTHGLEVDHLSAEKCRRCFPMFQLPGEWDAAFEPRAGYLDVEDCLEAHLAEAQNLGAELRTGVTVNRWRSSGNTVTVETDAGAFKAAKLVIAAGSWSGTLLADLGIRLEVRRKSMFWYPIGDDSLRADRGCPVYLFETPAGVFYGVPQVDERGFKVAEHSGGQPIDDPLAVNRDLDAVDQEHIESFLSKHIPKVGRPFLKHCVCLYTMSPDENFIVDVHPNYENVAFAAGLSGHGFKFTSVLGEALADLALNRTTDLPIGFLSCQRIGEV